MSSFAEVVYDRNGSGTPRRQRLFRKRRPGLNRMWVLAPVLLLIAGIAVILQQRQRDIVTVNSERAEVRNLVHVVSGTGKVRPEHEVRISPEVAGEIVNIPVRLGQKVRTGDLLVKIKPDNYVAGVKQAEASLVAVKAESAMRQAEMLNNERDRQRSEELFAKKLISDAEYFGAETRASVSRAAYESSLAQIGAAQSNLDQSNDLLQKCTIVSPGDGTIDSLNSEIGERVVATGSFAGTEMMRIADLQSMQAWVDINEIDIVKVRVGNRVKVHIDAYPERDFFGVVERIAGRASVQNEGTQQEVTNFEVRIQILRPEIAIRPGMSASVDIQTETAHQALAVPIQSVTSRNMSIGKAGEQLTDDQPADKGGVEKASERNAPERILFVVQEGFVKMTKVEVGIADDNYIQIISGIKAGDEVVAGPYTAISRDLKEGTAVKNESL